MTFSIFFFSIQLADDFVEPVVSHLDADTIQNLLDVFGTGGGIVSEGGQQVGGDVTHLGLEDPQACNLGSIRVGPSLYSFFGGGVTFRYMTIWK